MSDMPFLYKRTVTGAIQVWRQERDGNRYRTISGQQDGQHVISEWTVCEGKNLGRSNETTPEEQAASEVASNYKKKLAQGGYHESVEDVDKAKYFKPMLAQPFDKHPPAEELYEEGDIASQPKLDGVRCILNEEGMWSRQGKPIHSAPHIREQLAILFEEDSTATLDGELYAHKLHNDFNRIVSLVKKQKPTPEQLVESAETIEYWVYDLPSHEGGFRERFVALQEIVEALGDQIPNIVLVDTRWPTTLDERDAIYQEYLENGMEGQMLRLADGLYEQKRSKNLIKRKEFVEEEFPIIRFEEGTGNRSGMAARVIIRLPDGREGEASLRGTFDYCRQLLEEGDKYAVGEVTVRFQNYTPDGFPRFGVAVAIYEEGRDI